MSDIELITSRELRERLLVAVVMRQRVPVAFDADLRHRGARTFVPGIEGYDTGHVGLEGQHNDVVHRPQVLAQPFQRNVAVELPGDVRSDLGPWILTGYDDCRAMLRDARLGKDWNGFMLSSGLDGRALFEVDLANLPGGVLFQPGETWNFQMWFRDFGPTSNTTDGVAISYQ